VSAIDIVGGGLAGTEAALLLAGAGVDVRLHEQKPERRSPAHKEDGLAELVCSNSLRSDNPHNAVGLLHEELRRLGSPVLAQADLARVPAGDALAVDRAVFSGGLTARVRAHPRIEVVAGEVRELPPGPAPCIVATGPLTGESLARALAEAVGASQLAFYDAIAPIVAGDSVDLSIAFAQSRYTQRDRDTMVEGVKALRRIVQAPAMARHIAEEAEPGPGCASDADILDYVRRRGSTVYHPVSTCRMGQDGKAVVDERLRVRGVAGLRVIDASIMPAVVSGNTNAATIMIAEKGADMVLEDARV